MSVQTQKFWSLIWKQVNFQLTTCTAKVDPLSTITLSFHILVSIPKFIELSILDYCSFMHSKQLTSIRSQDLDIEVPV